ncbi:MAG: hypothetical protein ACTS2F_02815 [Thainema sp.]
MEITTDTTNTLDLITVGLAIAIIIGGFLMMFTNIWTTKRNTSNKNR